MTGWCAGSRGWGGSWRCDRGGSWANSWGCDWRCARTRGRLGDHDHRRLGPVLHRDHRALAARLRRHGAHDPDVRGVHAHDGLDLVDPPACALGRLAVGVRGPRHRSGARRGRDGSIADD